MYWLLFETNNHNENNIKFYYTYICDIRLIQNLMILFNKIKIIGNNRHEEN
jgi:hypothetical protein